MRKPGNISTDGVSLCTVGSGKSWVHHQCHQQDDAREKVRICWNYPHRAHQSNVRTSRIQSPIRRCCWFHCAISLCCLLNCGGEILTDVSLFFIIDPSQFRAPQTQETVITWTVWELRLSYSEEVHFLLSSDALWANDSGEYLMHARSWCLSGELGSIT